jgi:hypothetical protein
VTHFDGFAGVGVEIVDNERKSSRSADGIDFSPVRILSAAALRSEP